MSLRSYRVRAAGLAASGLIALAVGPIGLHGAWAQSGGTPRPVAAGPESGPRWQDLTPAQRAALKPLAVDWAGIDAARKQKWLEIANRYPKMPPQEQERLSARMAEWARMSPGERGQARLNFQSARDLSPQERQARWEAYQSLPPEQRSKLAARAAPGSSTLRKDGKAGAVRRPAPPPADTVQPKSNIVPNPSYAATPRPVAPTVVQAAPGATTSLISKRPAPPTHQQPGLPKIAATPGFVDKQTLLPQRGAQGAAVVPAEPAPKKRQ
jgi:hypothetical protein